VKADKKSKTSDSLNNARRREQLPVRLIARVVCNGVHGWFHNG
jgi:hypothetical protein